MELEETDTQFRTDLMAVVDSHSTTHTLVRATFDGSVLLQHSANALFHLLSVTEPVALACQQIL